MEVVAQEQVLEGSLGFIVVSQGRGAQFGMQETKDRKKKKTNCVRFV